MKYPIKQVIQPQKQGWQSNFEDKPEGIERPETFVKTVN